jgi:hypothetical protein
MARPASKETRIIQQIIQPIPLDRLGDTSPADLREAVLKKKLDYEKWKATISNELSKARKKAGVSRSRKQVLGTVAPGWDLGRYSALMLELSQFVGKCGCSPQAAKDWLGEAYLLVTKLGGLDAAKAAIDTLEAIKSGQDESSG